MVLLLALVPGPRTHYRSDLDSFPTHDVRCER